MRFATRLLSLFMAALALLPAAAATYGAHVGAAPQVEAAPVQHPLASGTDEAGRLGWALGLQPAALAQPLAAWSPRFLGSGAPAPSVFSLKPAAYAGLVNAPALHAALAPLPFQVTPPSLSVFPNPARGLLTVQLSAQQGPDYKLRLSNVLGREVRLLPLPLATAATGLPLDVTGLPAGLYFCSLLVNDKAVSTNRLTLL